jgi:hypothetical protein
VDATPATNRPPDGFRGMSKPKSSIFEQPSDVDAVDGAVRLDGPDAVNVALTPEAAEETSERLLAEAVRARGQRRLRHNPHQPKD